MCWVRPGNRGVCPVVAMFRRVSSLGVPLLLLIKLTLHACGVNNAYGNFISAGQGASHSG